MIQGTAFKHKSQEASFFDQSKNIWSNWSFLSSFNKINDFFFFQQREKFQGIHQKFWAIVLSFSEVLLLRLLSMFVRKISKNFYIFLVHKSCKHSSIGKTLKKV